MKWGKATEGKKSTEFGIYHRGTENPEIKKGKFFNSSNSVPSVQSGTLRLQSPRFADTPTRRYVDSAQLRLWLRCAENFIEGQGLPDVLEGSRLRLPQPASLPNLSGFGSDAG